MERIRALVAKRNGQSVQAPTALALAQNKATATPKAAVARETVRLEVPPLDLSGLHSEIEVALEGTRRVGQINPRNPGILSAIIQFVKKVMRRSLSWYTRPIHYFQGGVIRALQQTERILQRNDDSMGLLAEKLNTQSKLIEAENGALKNGLAEVNNKIASLEHAHREVSDRLNHEFGLLREKIDQLDSHHERLNQLQESHSHRIASTASDLGQLQSLMTGLNERVRQLELQGRIRERDIRRFVYDLRNGEIRPPQREVSAPVPPMFPTGICRERDFDYFAFEDLYRGDEESIRQRQQVYLEYFRGRQNVIDVGCGRGEFLELLRESQISAKGVELGTDHFQLCREKGLDVVQQDLFTYLESLPDESLGGLFSAQLIEHLTASDQLRYVRLAYEKTAPGSPVIFETINAQCVWAVMRNFFLDPTHVRPIHPETLKFAMETVNFRNVELRFSSPMSDRVLPPLPANENGPAIEEFNRRLADLNEFLYGNQDYAAIGWH